MDSKLITSALLKRYQQGNCTPEEVELVKEWLASAEDDIVQEHNKLEELGIETKMWNTIRKSIDAAPPVVSIKTRVLKWLPYTAAAAVVALLLWSGMRFSSSEDRSKTVVLQLNNTGNQLALASADDLIITTLPQTNVAMYTGGELLHDRIDFCDIMVLTNNGSEDVKLMFKANCTDTQGLPVNYVCKSGETYIVYRYKNIERIDSENNQQMVVLSKNQIASNMLPKYAQLNLLERLKNYNI